MHKPYRMPEDPIYHSPHAGYAGKEGIGFAEDDSGDNISAMNPRLCKLISLYWTWKKLDADYINLVHYKRHCTVKPYWTRIWRDPFGCILSGPELEKILSDHDMVLPKHRKYYYDVEQAAVKMFQVALL